MSDDMLMIDFDKIDAAWKRRIFIFDEDLIWIPVNTIGLNACEDCNGEGYERYSDGAYYNEPCEYCRGRGWVVK